MNSAVTILVALALGLVAGIASAASGGNWVDTAIGIADPIGGLWLRGLQMTIVPLVVALLITGITAAADAARAGRLAARALVLFLAVLWSSSLAAALLMPLFYNLWPLPEAAAAALRSTLTASPPVGDVPSIGEFLRAIVPTNPIAAAATDNILPLMVFTTVFAFAITRLPPVPRERLSGLFSALADAMLVVIGWVLALAPIGVAALAFVVGARAGGAAFGALLHYVIVVSAIGIIVWLAAYPLAVFGARTGLLQFARAAIPAQAVAISTQSSLASLPAMLKGTQTLGIAPATADIVLPLAVALFRATGPAMNLAVALYIAYWFGIPLGPAQITAGIIAAAITTMGAVSLPGQVSFFTSIAPIALAMGVPVEPLALLIAVETIPDIFRTVGNVTMDLAVTATVAARHDSPDVVPDVAARAG